AGARRQPRRHSPDLRCAARALSPHPHRQGPRLPDLRYRSLRRRALSAKAIGAVPGAASAFLLLAAAGFGSAAAADNDASLKVPRFVSLHADRVNLRAGPGAQYPIEWVLTKKDMPVQIIAQFEHWRRVRDWEGTEGWVQERMVGGKRTVVVNKGGVRPIFQRPDPAASVIAR